MPDFERQILEEFTELVQIISSEVMANTVTPAFRDEVEHWTYKAQEKINNLEKLFHENVLILNNLVKNASQSLENALLALANNRVEIRDLFRQTERLEQSLKNLSETATLPDKLTEINLNLKKLSVLTSQIEQHSNEYQRLLSENQKELFLIKQSFLQTEEKLLYDNQKANQKLIETGERLKINYSELTTEIKQTEAALKNAFLETENNLIAQLTRLQEIGETTKGLSENSFNELKATANTLATNIIALQTQMEKNKEVNQDEMAVLRTEILKKLDILTVAVFIFGSAVLTLLVWIMFI